MGGRLVGGWKGSDQIIFLHLECRSDDRVLFLVRFATRPHQVLIGTV